MAERAESVNAVYAKLRLFRHIARIASFYAGVMHIRNLGCSLHSLPNSPQFLVFQYH